MEQSPKQFWQDAQTYFLARIEKAQPNPDPRLFQGLGEAAWELSKLKERDE